MVNAAAPVYLFKPPVVDAENERKAVFMAAAVLTAQPNPFHSSVTLTLPGALSTGAQVKIFDLSGRLVADLSGKVCHGRAIWTAAGMPSGIYVAAARKGALELTKKIIYSR
jgi:hypothetical protein